MIDPVVATTLAETKAQKASSKLATDMDSFLLLLTTQLKNQDPLSPLEPTEFTSQLVAFSGVEQQITTNKHLEDLLALQNASLAASVVGFIGTMVEAQGNKVPLQDGTAEFSYNLSGNAKNVVVAISDSNGKIMYTQAGELTGGDHKFTWDGKDMNGFQQPDGPYTVTVTPIGFEDKPVEVRVKVKGRVSGVSMETGAATLDVGGVSIALEDVLTITEAKTTQVGEAGS